MSTPKYCEVKGGVPAPLPKIGRAVCCLEREKVKHTRVLQLISLATALLPINFVLKLDIERGAGGTVQVK